MRKTLIEIMFFCILIAPMQTKAYDWQKHVPDHAKQYIQNVNNDITQNDKKATFTGVTSLKSQTYDEITVYGPLNIESSNISSLSSFGPASIKKSSLSKLFISGPLSISSTTIDHLEVAGPFSATGRSRIKGSIKVMGPIYIEDSKVESNLVAYSNDIKFKNVNIYGDITIESDYNHKPPKLKLENSNITGSVTFSKMKGVVEKDSNSVIEGGIIGIK
ncbi:MAG: hypothetical protein AAF673_01385 [Pseudomonadota bacterium]